MINYEVLFAWTALTVIGSFVIEQFLKKFFQTIAHDRRRYITKNLLKSFLLTILALYSGPMMWNFIVNNVIDNTFIHTTGFMYAIPDIYALIWVPRSMFQKSTIYHHLCVGVLAFLSLIHDYEKDSHWKAMLVYAYLSMLTGIVNFYLGARFVLNRNNVKEDNQRARLATYSLLIYIASIIVNWSYQIFVVVSSINDCMRELHLNISNIGSVWPSWSAAIVWKADVLTDLLGLFQNIGTLASIIGYCGIIYFIVQDDIDLIKKLKMETALSKLKN